MNITHGHDLCVIEMDAREQAVFRCLLHVFELDVIAKDMKDYEWQLWKELDEKV